MDSREGERRVDADFIARVAPAAAAREERLDLIEMDLVVGMSTSIAESKQVIPTDQSINISPKPSSKIARLLHKNK